MSYGEYLIATEGTQSNTTPQQLTNGYHEGTGIGWGVCVCVCVCVYACVYVCVCVYVCKCLSRFMVSQEAHLAHIPGISKDLPRLPIDVVYG